MSLGPKDGTGPSDETMKKNGPFSFVFFGRTPSGQEVRAEAFCPFDPHRGTAALLADTAFCVATQRDSLLEQSGFWTPGTAIGDMLQEQLAKIGSIKFEVKQAA